MGNRQGTVVAIDDGFAIVRIAVADGRPAERLIHVPQQVLPAAAVGERVAVEVADWELDARVLLICLPPVILALAGGLILGSAPGAVAGAALGALMAWLATRETHHGSARAAPHRSLRSVATTK